MDVRPSGNLPVRKCGLNIVESPLVKMVSRGSNKMLTVSISITVFNPFSERSDIVEKELAAAPINIAKRGSGQALVGVAGATKIMRTRSKNQFVQTFQRLAQLRPSTVPTLACAGMQLFPVA